LGGGADHINQDAMNFSYRPLKKIIDCAATNLCPANVASYSAGDNQMIYLVPNEGSQPCRFMN
jgi:hypothetical protein